MSDNEPKYNLVLNEKYVPINDELRKSSEEELRNYKFVVEKIGEARGWGGNPRWDLIIQKGLEYYLKGKD